MNQTQELQKKILINSTTLTKVHGKNTIDAQEIRKKMSTHIISLTYKELAQIRKKNQPNRKMYKGYGQFPEKEKYYS